MSFHYDPALDGRFPAIHRDTLIARLQSGMPGELILSDPEDLRPYECDGLAAYQVVPLLVVLPENVTQVRHVMRVCSELMVPVVARGAGTGPSHTPLDYARDERFSLLRSCASRAAWTSIPSSATRPIRSIRAGGAGS